MKRISLLIDFKYEENNKKGYDEFDILDKQNQHHTKGFLLRADGTKKYTPKLKSGYPLI